MAALKEDFLRCVQMKGGGTLRKVQQSVRTPGLQAIAVYRFGHWVTRQPRWQRMLLLPIYVLLNHRMKAKWGIDIARRATIGGGLFIPHYGGIFIGEECIIGKNVAIGHEVTLAIGDRGGAPVIGDNVAINPGAKVIGRVRIGNNVKIGPNTVIFRDIPDGASVAPATPRLVVFPSRIEPSKGERETSG